MIRRLFRYTIRYTALTLIGFAVARVVDVIRQSSDPAVPPASGSDGAPFPTVPAKVAHEPEMAQGPEPERLSERETEPERLSERETEPERLSERETETATPPHGDPLVPPTPDEKPPSSPPPAGKPPAKKKAPAAKKVPAKKAPAPPKPPTADSPPEEPKGGS